MATQSGPDERRLRQLDRQHQAQVRQLEKELRSSRAQRDGLEKELRVAKAALRELGAELALVRLRAELAEALLLQDAAFGWVSVRRVHEPAVLDLGEDARPTAMPDAPAPISFPLLRDFRAARAQRRYAQQREFRTEAERVRRERVRRRTEAHEAAEAQAEREVEAHNRHWDDVRAGVERGDRASTEEYLEAVLAHQLQRVAGFPGEVEVAYLPADHRAVVRSAVPHRSSVPPSVADGDALYRSLVGQVALLRLRALFSALPPLAHVHLAGFPGAAQRGRPALIEVECDRPTFEALGLHGRPQLQECLRKLDARFAT